MNIFEVKNRSISIVSLFEAAQVTGSNTLADLLEVKNKKSDGSQWGNIDISNYVQAFTRELIYGKEHGLIETGEGKLEYELGNSDKSISHELLNYDETLLNKFIDNVKSGFIYDVLTAIKSKIDSLPEEQQQAEHAISAEYFKKEKELDTLSDTYHNIIKELKQNVNPEETAKSSGNYALYKDALSKIIGIEERGNPSIKSSLSKEEWDEFKQLSLDIKSLKAKLVLLEDKKDDEKTGILYKETESALRIKQSQFDTFVDSLNLDPKLRQKYSNAISVRDQYQAKIDKHEQIDQAYKTVGSTIHKLKKEVDGLQKKVIQSIKDIKNRSTEGANLLSDKEILDIVNKRKSQLIKFAYVIDAMQDDTIVKVQDDNEDKAQAQFNKAATSANLYRDIIREKMPNMFSNIVTEYTSKAKSELEEIEKKYKLISTNYKDGEKELIVNRLATKIEPSTPLYNSIAKNSKGKVSLAEILNTVSAETLRNALSANKVDPETMADITTLIKMHEPLDKQYRKRLDHLKEREASVKAEISGKEDDQSLFWAREMTDTDKSILDEYKADKRNEISNLQAIDDVNQLFQAIEDYEDIFYEKMKAINKVAEPDGAIRSKEQLDPSLKEHADPLVFDFDTAKQIYYREELKTDKRIPGYVIADIPLTDFKWLKDGIALPEHTRTDFKGIPDKKAGPGLSSLNRLSMLLQSHTERADLIKSKIEDLGIKIRKTISGEGIAQDEIQEIIHMLKYSSPDAIDGVILDIKNHAFPTLETDTGILKLLYTELAELRQIFTERQDAIVNVNREINELVTKEIIYSGDIAPNDTYTIKYKGGETGFTERPVDVGIVIHALGGNADTVDADWEKLTKFYTSYSGEAYDSMEAKRKAKALHAEELDDLLTIRGNFKVIFDILVYPKFMINMSPKEYEKEIMSISTASGKKREIMQQYTNALGLTVREDTNLIDTKEIGYTGKDKKFVKIGFMPSNLDERYRKLQKKDMKEAGGGATHLALTSRWFLGPDNAPHYTVVPYTDNKTGKVMNILFDANESDFNIQKMKGIITDDKGNIQKGKAVVDPESLIITMEFEPNLYEPLHLQEIGKVGEAPTKTPVEVVGLENKLEGIIISKFDYIKKMYAGVELPEKIRKTIDTASAAITKTFEPNELTLFDYETSLSKKGTKSEETFDVQVQSQANDTKAKAQAQAQAQTVDIEQSKAIKKRGLTDADILGQPIQ